MVCPFSSKMPTGLFPGTLLEIWPSLRQSWHKWELPCRIRRQFARQTCHQRQYSSTIGGVDTYAPYTRSALASSGRTHISKDFGWGNLSSEEEMLEVYLYVTLFWSILVCHPLCTLKLVYEECREKDIVHPVPLNGRWYTPEGVYQLSTSIFHRTHLSLSVSLLLSNTQYIDYIGLPIAQHSSTWQCCWSPATLLLFSTQYWMYANYRHCCKYHLYLWLFSQLCKKIMNVWLSVQTCTWK